MKKMVLGDVLPCLNESGSLRRQCRVGNEDSFLRESAQFKHSDKKKKKKLTGLFVVPEVYNIIPPISEARPSSSSLTSPTSSFPPAKSPFRTAKAGSRARPLFKRSRAFSENLSVARSTLAIEFSIIYFNSGIGKAGERGTAMPLLARMERRITIFFQLAFIYTSQFAMEKRETSRIPNTRKGKQYLRNHNYSPPKKRFSSPPSRLCPCPLRLLRPYGEALPSSG